MLLFCSQHSPSPILPFPKIPTTEFPRNLPFQWNSWSELLKRDLSWVLLSNADNFFDVYQSFSFVKWMDFIYLYLAAARKIFKASRWDFKTSLQMKKSKSLTFKENKREHELYTWTHIIQKKRKRLSLGLQMYDLDIHCSSGRKKGLFSSDLVEEEAQCIRWFLNPSPSTAWPGTLKPIIRNTSLIYSFVNSLSHLLSPLIYSSKNLFTSDCPVPNPVLSVESSEIIAASLQMSALQTERQACTYNHKIRCFI